MIENESSCVPSYKYSNLLLYNSLTVLKRSLRSKVLYSESR